MSRSEANLSPIFVAVMGFSVFFMRFLKSRSSKSFLVDRCEPESRKKIIAAVEAIAPWIGPKLINRECRIDSNHLDLPTGTAVVSAHACGVLSDACIAAAIKCSGPLGILPCCYPKSGCQAPAALQRALGLRAAYDVDRTYRLEAAGYLSCVGLRSLLILPP